jgi:prophage endopeptidase
MTALLSLLLNPRVLLAVGLLAAAVGAYLWVDHRGYARGAAATEATWQAREAEELSKANAEIEKLNREARARETAYAMDLEAVASDYEKDLRNAKRSRDAAMAALRAGTLELRDPGAAPCQGAGAGRPGEAPAGAGRRDGGADGRLSGEAAAFLLDLAAEADAVVLQLHACQRVVQTDRAF